MPVHQNHGGYLGVYENRDPKIDQIDPQISRIPL